MRASRDTYIFLVAILAAILKILQLLLLISTYLNSTSFTSYESTFHLSVYIRLLKSQVTYRTCLQS